MRDSIRKYSGLMIFTILCLQVSGVAAQQMDFDKIQIKTHHVHGNIYMLEGAGGNIGGRGRRSLYYR